MGYIKEVPDALRGLGCSGSCGGGCGCGGSCGGGCGGGCRGGCGCGSCRTASRLSESYFKPEDDDDESEQDDDAAKTGYVSGYGAAAPSAFPRQRGWFGYAGRTPRRW
jgi:hypothetical protein